LSAQRAQIRKQDLAIALQQLGPHPKPKIALEQYTIPANLAAEILYTARYVHDDIQDKTVLDLGTGTGRLAIGASILGASYVVGVDVDRVSLSLAMKNSGILTADVDWVLGDIETVRGPFDTVLMNPPFGTKHVHADLVFLECALKSGSVVYSIHKSSTRKFLSQWLQTRGITNKELTLAKMEIPHQFSFHRKLRRFVEVDVLRIEQDQPK
jgi:putative methylase